MGAISARYQPFSRAAGTWRRSMRRVLLACQGVNSHSIGFNVPSDRPVGVPAHALYPVWDRHGECHRQQQLSGGCPVALGPRQRLGTAGSWDGASRELCSQPSRCDTPSPLHIPTGSCVGIPRVWGLEEPERCSGCSPTGTFGVRGNTGTSRGRTRPHSGTIQLYQSAAPRDGRRVLIANGLRPRAGSGRGGELAALMRGHRDTGMDRAAAGQSRAVQCCAVPSRAEPCRAAPRWAGRAVPRSAIRRPRSSGGPAMPCASRAASFSPSSSSSSSSRCWRPPAPQWPRRGGPVPAEVSPTPGRCGAAPGATRTATSSWVRSCAPTPW